MRYLVLTLLITCSFLGKTQTISDRKQHKIDSLNYVLDTISSDKKYIKNLGRLYGYYSGDNSTEKIDVLTRMLVKCESKFQDSLSKKDSLYYRITYGTALNNIGLTYRRTNDFENALTYYFRALNFREIWDNPKKIATSAINIGTVYGYLGESEKAIKYFNRVIDDTSMYNTKFYPIALMNKAHLLIEQENFELALECYNKSLTVYERFDDSPLKFTEIAKLYASIGMAYFQIDHIDSASLFLERGLKIH
jgi:tetratricopeptide (TPR) repeat protein